MFEKVTIATPNASLVVRENLSGSLKLDFGSFMGYFLWLY
jgi:hypothetical protein